MRKDGGGGEEKHHKGSMSNGLDGLACHATFEVHEYRQREDTFLCIVYMCQAQEMNTTVFKREIMPAVWLRC